ncbi:MAG TPA: NUDIX hydrolase [Trinickia sp.]|uniref:NUDIX hydrolase n=1 Tax=Trinickia sp. TaxID=2571163 RepID=UPI002C0B197F|nr:NUDIX hydrolase [Trinickia sp.]HVW53508.1 NUDIX hydrolase [Trinickia sp.]
MNTPKDAGRNTEPVVALGSLSLDSILDEETLGSTVQSLADGAPIRFDTSFPEEKFVQVRDALWDAGFDQIRFAREPGAHPDAYIVTAIVLPRSPAVFESATRSASGERITHRWEKVENKKGSTPGGVYRRTSSDGTRGSHYVKFPPRAIQAVSEHIGLCIARDLDREGAPGELVELEKPEVDYSRTVTGGGDGIALSTPYQTDLRGSAFELGLQHDPDIAKSYFNNVARDLLLANWDACGGVTRKEFGHNLLIKQEPTEGAPEAATRRVVQWDFGGVLLCRARWNSPLKPPEALDTMTEARYFFDLEKNPAMASLAQAAGYDSIFDVPGLRAQIDDVVSLREQHGNWANYVAKVAPQFEGEQRDAVVGMLEARTRALLELAPRAHPHRDELGRAVKIEAPTTPSDETTWHDPSASATFVPGGRAPARLNGIAIRPLSADWVPPLAHKPIDEPRFETDSRLAPAAGCIVLEPDGRVWLVEPTNGFGGHRLTLPKGRLGRDPTLGHAAIRETREELGIEVELERWLGDGEGASTRTRFYLAKRIGGSPTAMGWESQAAHLVPQDQLLTVLTHPRDLKLVRQLVEEGALAL